MSDEERRTEAERILRRLEQQSEKTSGGSSPEPGRRDEWTERWGRRAGLLIGYLLAAALLVHLLATYVAR